MTDLWQWVTTQPDTVKGAIFASTIAITGVILNNVVTAWNTGRQLKHDREQKSSERAIALRREIYLGVAQHIQEGINTITRCADLTLDHKTIFQAKSESAHFMAKMHLMAKPALLKAVAIADEAINNAIVRTRIRREAVLGIQKAVERQDQQLGLHHKAAMQLDQQLSAKRLAGDASNDEVSRLQGQLAHEAAKVDELLTALNASSTELKRSHYELFAFAWEEQRQIYPLLTAAVTAARDELGESIDMTVYKDLLTVEAPEYQANLKQLFGVPDLPEAQCR